MTRRFLRAAPLALSPVALSLKAALALAVLAPMLAAPSLAFAKKAPSRTLEITVNEFTITPPTLAVAPGETVLLRVKNTGSLLHQFAIGSAATLDAAKAQSHMLVMHGVLQPDRLDSKAAAEMEQSMGHTAHAATVLTIPAGQQAEMVWTADAGKNGETAFLCPVPGHAEAGMTGTVSLAP